MSIKRKIMIRKGNDNHYPCIVYVSHLNSMGFWCCFELNTGYMHLSKATDLIAFEYRTYMQMFYQWKITSADKSKERFKELLIEWGGEYNG